MRSIVVVMGLLGMAALSGCGGKEKCESDLDCAPVTDPYARCELPSGLCRCTDDRACGPTEICNAAGNCQVESGCVTNDECGDDLFCDTALGVNQCLAVEECSPGPGEVCCTLDSQCPFGNVCDGLLRKCVAGCRDSGDCRLEDSCFIATPGTRGVCANFCTADRDCPFGSLCNVLDGRCVEDTRGPYCDGCSGGVASDDCGTPGNFCIEDTVNGGAFCGVDCGLGQACPFGYGCRDVRIVSRSECRLEDENPAGNCAEVKGRAGSCTADTNVACASDADCPVGGCDLYECRGREGATRGFCSCTKDNDCVSDRCVGADNSDPQSPRPGNCELSGRQCLGDVECDTITCVAGGCLIGRNCTPNNDRTCVDVLPVR